MLSPQESVLNQFHSEKMNYLIYGPENSLWSLKRPKVPANHQHIFLKQNLVKPIKSSSLTKISQEEAGKSTGVLASLRLVFWTVYCTKILGLQELSYIARI